VYGVFGMVFYILYFFCGGGFVCGGGGVFLGFFLF
jgi:hypothetical protein